MPAAYVLFQFSTVLVDDLFDCLLRLSVKVFAVVVKTVPGRGFCKDHIT